MSRLQQIASNTVVQLIGRGIGTLFGILTVALITRALGTDGYGQFTLALTFLAVAGALADFGFTLTTTQLLSDRSTNDDDVVSTAFTMRLLSGLLFFSIAVALAWLTPYSTIVKLAISVGSFSFFFMTTGQMLVGVYQKNFAMWRPALAEAVSRGLILALVLWFALRNATPVTMMTAFTVGNALMLLMNLGLTRRFLHVRLRIDPTLARLFLKRSWPIAISIFFNLLYLKGDILFLSIWRSDAEIGLYGAAYKVLDVISVIPTMFMGLLLPLLVDAWQHERLQEVRELLQQALDFFALFGFPLLGGCLVLAEPMMRLVAGEAFAGSGGYLQVLMVANTIVFFGILSGHAIVSMNRQRHALPAYIVTAIIALTLYYLTIPTWGAWGAAWTTVFSELLIASWTMTLVVRQSRFRPRWRNLLVYTVATTGMAASVAALTTLFAPLSALTLCLLICLGALIYGALVLLMGGVRRETLRLVFARRI